MNPESPLHSCLVSLSIPPISQASTAGDISPQPKAAMASKQSTTDLSSAREVVAGEDASTSGAEYPLAYSTTPPGLKQGSLDAIHEGGGSAEESLQKRCCRSRSPRKRSVTCENCHKSFGGCYKRARLKIPCPPVRARNDGSSYFDACTGAFPSPSPTPLIEHMRRDDGSKDGAMTRLPCRMANVTDAFDSLSPDMKSYLLFQLLKRSTTSNLQFISSVISPVLRCDFLASLPRELALHMVSFLDVQSLCQATRVSRTWRAIIESDEGTWRRLLERDGYIPDGLGKEADAAMRHTGSLATRHPSLSLQHPLAMDVDSETPETMTRPPMQQPGTPHPFKDIYRRHHTLRQNWRQGRAKRISFYGHTRCVVTCLQFDDEKIISGLDDCLINIYDTKTGLHLRTLEGHEGGVWALKYVGNTLVSGSTDRTVRVWDIERGVCTHVFTGHTSTVRCLQIVMPTMVDGSMQPSQPLIVTGSRDCTLRVWRLPDPLHNETYTGTGPNPWYMHTLAVHSHSVRAIAVHGSTLVSGSYDNTVGVWNLETGRLVHRMQGHTQRVYAVVIDAERRRCTSGSMDSTVRVWDLATGENLQVLEGHSILVGLLGLSRHHLVSAAADSTLRVWSPETGACKHVLSGHPRAITCFQHDDEKVISGSEGVLKMWDIKTGHHITDLITNVQCTWQVAFDKRRCIAAVKRNEETSFEVLDFGVHGLEDEEDQAMLSSRYSSLN